MNKVHYMSKYQAWMTPKSFLKHVREYCRRFGYTRIGLDPASTKDNPTGAWTYYTPDSVAKGGGLGMPWTGLGPVFCNPPYGREVGKWTGKARYESKLGNARSSWPILMLVPSRTDTRWYHEAGFTAKCEVKGRLKFEDENGAAKTSAPFPSVVLLWARQSAQVRVFKSVFDEVGLVWTR